MLEIDACHEYCEPCRLALSGLEAAPAMATVEDAEADSVRWLIERGS